MLLLLLLLLLLPVRTGHVHSYESIFPLCNFTTGALCDGEQGFVEPKGTVHVTEGNGGVPGTHANFSVTNCTVRA